MNCLFRSVASRSSFAALMILGGSHVVPGPECTNPHSANATCKTPGSPADGQRRRRHADRHSQLLGQLHYDHNLVGHGACAWPESDCTLTLATGSYTVTGSTLNYTETDLIPGYERVLHTEAQLTTPDVFRRAAP